MGKPDISLDRVKYLYVWLVFNIFNRLGRGVKAPPQICYYIQHIETIFNSLHVKFWKNEKIISNYWGLCYQSSGGEVCVYEENKWFFGKKSLKGINPTFKVVTFFLTYKLSWLTSKDLLMPSLIIFNWKKNFHTLTVKKELIILF